MLSAAFGRKLTLIKIPVLIFPLWGRYKCSWLSVINNDNIGLIVEILNGILRKRKKDI
jgi:hypothetical protein